jgi:hypothetical protein
MSDDEKREAQQRYQAALLRRNEYQEAVEARRHSPAFLKAPKELTKTVRDLERRGLLQYDGQARRYDLHPVVRGVAAGGLRQEEKESYGQRVVDHFSARSHNPYDEAETLDDIRDGLHVVRTFVQMGRVQEAVSLYRGDLSDALLFNLEAFPTAVSLLRPFFPRGWSSLPSNIAENDASYLANHAGLALLEIGQLAEADAAFNVSLQVFVRLADWASVGTEISNIAISLNRSNRRAAQERAYVVGLALAECLDLQQALFTARLDFFSYLSSVGRLTEAEKLWEVLDPMGRDWDRAIYRAGTAEMHFARHQFRSGGLREESLDKAEALARAGKNRPVIRELHSLRGEWCLGRTQWELAAASLHEAVRMAREVEQRDEAAEAQLALANFHLDKVSDPRAEAERLAARNPSHGHLAALWLAIGDREQAAKHALAAYKWAWADGEPYVRRYELNKARALLEQLGAEIPTLPPYDPVKDPKLPWEDDVAAAIEKLRAEKAAEESAEAEAATEESGGEN